MIPHPARERVDLDHGGDPLESLPEGFLPSGVPLSQTEGGPDPRHGLPAQVRQSAPSKRILGELIGDLQVAAYRARPSDLRLVPLDVLVLELESGCAEAVVLAVESAHVEKLRVDDLAQALDQV